MTLTHELSKQEGFEIEMQQYLAPNDLGNLEEITREILDIYEILQELVGMLLYIFYLEVIILLHII